MGWSIEPIQRIRGAVLHNPHPVIDGFRMVHADGSEQDIKFRKRMVRDGWLYLFNPSIELSSTEKATLRFHSTVAGTLDIKVILESFPVDKLVAQHRRRESDGL